MHDITKGWGGGGHKLMSQWHYFGKSSKSSWNLNRRPFTSQTLLPLNHLDRIVCRCPLRRTVHHLSLCFCLQFTFTGSYYFWNDLCDVMSLRTLFSTKEHLVSTGAVKYSLSCHTHNLPGSLKGRQKWPAVARSLGSKSWSPSQYIISICYPLSFIRKVEHSYHL